jgi:hypothetical protein
MPTISFEIVSTDRCTIKDRISLASGCFTSLEWTEQQYLAESASFVFKSSGSRKSKKTGNVSPTLNLSVGRTKYSGEYT